jgi:methyl-accepting chemotaxis protein
MVSIGNRCDSLTLNDPISRIRSTEEVISSTEEATSSVEEATSSVEEAVSSVEGVVPAVEGKVEKTREIVYSNYSLLTD